MTAPPLPQALKLMNQAMAARDFGRAKLLALQIVAADPHQADALAVLGEITLMQGLWDEARDFAERAASQRPDDLDLMLLCARVAQARGDSAGTIGWCDKALARRPGDLSALVAKATALERAGDWQQAEAILARAMNASAPSPSAAQVWAQILLRKGDAKGARKVIDRGLAQYTPLRPAPRPVKARLLFLKAKALDRMQDYDGAFRTALQAKATAAVPFDAAAFVARVDSIIRAFDREALAARPRARPTGTRHVFIAGMPRSGTTLVEQILDAHPRAAGVGEAKEIDILASRLPAMLATSVPYPECVKLLSQPQLDALRAEYEQAQLRHGYGPAEVYVNKNLENHVHLGLISMLFPDAVVIVPRRDPRDVAVSCVMSNFKPEKHPYLSTLEHIALAFRQWERLMAHWKGILDLRFLDVGYEALVSEQDGWTRRMLERAGLEWDERCSRFWQSGRTVMTLSYDQVSRPIYHTSIGRWRHYEAHLAPFVRAMGGPEAFA